MKIEDLGQIVATRAVSDLQTENEEFKLFVFDCFNRHMKHDWGDLEESDWKMNDQAMKSNKDRIFSSYSFPPNAQWKAINTYGGQENKLWIITEWDHSVTTALFPGEY